MSYFDTQSEREKLQAVLERIQLGQVIIKRDGDEIVAELQQRLAGLDQRNPGKSA